MRELTHTLSMYWGGGGGGGGLLEVEDFCSHFTIAMGVGVAKNDGWGYVLSLWAPIVNYGFLAINLKFYHKVVNDFECDLKSHSIRREVN